jgi:hypothetical protein
MLLAGPSSTPDPCAAVGGAARAVCENRSPGSVGGGSSPTDSLDPLSSLAHSTATAAAWTARHLGNVINRHDQVDFTNVGFLQQYALVFAAGTILVLVLWLLAVAKRAIRGVPLGTAMGEAVSLLWLAVIATAFTPLILYVLVGAVGAVTQVLSGALGTPAGGVFASLGDNLVGGKLGGGPVILIIASLATILLCGALYLLLVLRALGLYVGALLGVAVYAGLVDRDLWGHVRRWAGFMTALILAEPVIVIILGLASAMQASQTHGATVTGLAITVIALGVSIFIIWRTPGFGDAVKVARLTARTAGGAARVITGGGSPAVGVQRGIATHGNRTGDTSGRAVNGTPRTPNPLSGGMGAHSQRQPSQPKNKKDKDGKQ